MNAYRRWSLPALAFVGFVASLASVNIAFIWGFFSLPAGVVTWVARLIDGQRRSVLTRVIVYGSCVVLLASAPLGCTFNSYRTEARLQPVIAALDALYAQNNKYPESLSELDGAIPLCPDPERAIVYSVATAATPSYTLTCYTYVFNKHSFSSETRKWTDWD